MGIQGAPQIVHHPLAYTRGQILLTVRTQCAQQSHDDQRDRCKIEQGDLVVASEGRRKGTEPFRQRLGLEQVIEYQFQGPRFQQVRDRYAQYSHEGKAECLPVGTQQIDELKRLVAFGGRHKGLGAGTAGGCHGAEPAVWALTSA